MRKPATHCAGQASTEYVIVTALMVVVLIVGALDPSPLEDLIEAIRTAYDAFSYVISFST